MTERTEKKPAVLIVGGLGYIGRFLALHIHQNDLASEVRLVDKQLPELARLPPEFNEACSRDKFLQADASSEQFTTKIFDRGNDEQFNLVFNCGGETRFSQEDEVYRARSYNLSLALGHEAARRKVSCFVECSTGQVYKPAQAPRKETDKLKPWSTQAKWKLSAEEGLNKIEGLNLCILRLANVYGPYTTGFLSTALCMARVYKYLEKDMKWLWDKDLMTNTVHVDDAVRALWRVTTWYRDSGRVGRTAATRDKEGSAPIFNIVDHGRTCQGTLADLIHQEFAMKTGFQGTVISAFARMHLGSVVDDVNDELLDEWADLQRENNIQPGPISPFVEAELLKDTDLSLDGSEFEKKTGFVYDHPSLTLKEMRAVLDSYLRMNWWPVEEPKEVPE